MAEGLNVLGSNVVYNTTRPVNQYLQSAAKLAAQQAAEQKMLQDDLNKVKIDGVRDADRQNYINKYQDWKDTYAKVIGTKDPVKKAELKSQFDKKALELQDFVYDSKSLAKGEQELNKVFLDPTKRDNFTDDAVLKFQKSKTLPKDDPNYIRDLTNFERRVDLSKVDDQFRQIDTDLMSRQQEGNPVTGAKVKVGNRMGTNLEYKTTVDPKSQAYNYGLAYDNNRDIKYAIKQQYKELFNTLPEEEAKTQAIADMVAKRPLAKVRNQLVMDEADWKEKAVFMAALRNATKKEGDDAAIYRQNQIDDIWSERNSASGAGNAVERLRAVVEANPLFKGANTSTMIRDTGRWINISVPERKVAYTTTDPEGNEILRYRKQDAYKVTIDKSNPDDKLKLNKVYDALTGEKISDSKLQTGNAGGKIKGDIYSEKGSKSTKEASMVTMILPNGQTGQIPSDKVKDFLKAYPKAKRQ